MRIDRLKKDCCGCTACAAVCPTKALSMVPDEEGFLYPELQAELCVNCDACTEVCSFQKDYERADGAIPSEYYAVVHQSDKVQKKSRSGGVFYAMATEILSRGGIVYGVALDAELNARTLRIDHEAALTTLQGSKYVQSDKGDSYSLAKEDLLCGRPVLFSGTACEISGLLSYLRAEKVPTDRLYTCDLVCHGAPSPKVWQDNLDHIAKRLGGRPDTADFRDKCFGWAPHIESYQKDGKVVFANRYTSVFYADVALRPSCSECHFCNYDRCADLTLADFWGIERTGLPIDPSRGVSCLMVHTERGKELMEQAKTALTVYPVQKEQTEQPNLKRPSPASAQRSAFWQDYQAHGYLAAAKRVYGPKERLKLVYNVVMRRKKS